MPGAWGAREPEKGRVQMQSSSPEGQALEPVGMDMDSSGGARPCFPGCPARPGV